MPMLCAQILHTFSHSNPRPWPCNSAVPPTKTEYIYLILEVGLIHMTCLANKMSPDEKEVRVKCACSLRIALWCFCHKNRRISLPSSLAQGGWEKFGAPPCNLQLRVALADPQPSEKWMPIIACPWDFCDFLSGCLFPESVSNLSVLHVLIHLNFLWIL